jgi:cyclophilin family peptidyl-prolyl cis-trans isomerase
VGRLVVQLRRDAVPAAADNFLALATAPLGYGYRNSALHGVEKGSRVFGGDFYGSGLAGQAAGGRRVPDEAPPSTAAPPLAHIGPGTVGMVTAGPGTINSQFYVTLRATPLFDGVHPVVGFVQNEQGHALLAYLDKCAAAGGAGNRFRPRHDFRIAACGVLPRPASPEAAAALLADGDGLPDLAPVGLAGLTLGKG